MRTPGLGHQTARAVSPSYSAPHPQSSNVGMTPLSNAEHNYVSRKAVAPWGVTPITDVLMELTRRDVELRVMPSLWPLHDAVVASTLQFSIIRMRNAAPHP